MDIFSGMRYDIKKVSVSSFLLSYETGGLLMIYRPEIKARARAAIRAARPAPLVMTAIILVIGLVLDRVNAWMSYGALLPELTELQYLLAGDPLYGMDPEAAMAAAGYVARSTTATFFFSIFSSLFLTVLWGGYYIYCMGLQQGVRLPYSTLFDGLALAGKLIWCQILMVFKVFWWSLLFILPGIVAAYRYRFAFYNLLTDSSLSASQAIALSCRQTRGMKGELFILDLSFLGWTLLSLLTLGILDIWLRPYMTLSDLGYFEQAQLALGRSPFGEQHASGGDDPWDM